MLCSPTRFNEHGQPGRAAAGACHALPPPQGCRGLLRGGHAVRLRPTGALSLSPGAASLRHQHEPPQLAGHYQALLADWVWCCADSLSLVQLDSEHSQSAVAHEQPQQQQRQPGASGTATPAERGLDEDDELMGMSPETSNPRQQPWGAKQRQAPQLQGWPQLGTPQQVHHHQQLRQRPQLSGSGQQPQQPQQLQQPHSTVGFEQHGLPALRTSWSSHTPSRMINQS